MMIFENTQYVSGVPEIGNRAAPQHSIQAAKRDGSSSWAMVLCLGSRIRRAWGALSPALLHLIQLLASEIHRLWTQQNWFGTSVYRGFRQAQICMLCREMPGLSAGHSCGLSAAAARVRTARLIAGLRSSGMFRLGWGKRNRFRAAVRPSSGIICGLQRHSGGDQHHGQNRLFHIRPHHKSKLFFSQEMLLTS
jgi:hypothetical protein